MSNPIDADHKFLYDQYVKYLATSIQYILTVATITTVAAAALFAASYSSTVVERQQEWIFTLAALVPIVIGLGNSIYASLKLSRIWNAIKSIEGKMKLKDRELKGISDLRSETSQTILKILLPAAYVAMLGFGIFATYCGVLPNGTCIAWIMPSSP